MESHSERPHVLILGGGFAGLAAALALRPDRHAVTLIDRARSFEFLPNIHELLSRVKEPDDLRLSLDVQLENAGHCFVQDTVTRIDPTRGTVETRRGREPLPYDALIVALGGVDATRGVSGVVEHALPFKSVDQCERIGRRLDRLAARRRPSRVVIVGGGLEGVEALGELLRRHRKSGIHVTLVEAGDRLLAEWPPSLDAHLRELCEPHAVEFEFECPVEHIEDGKVVLADGRSLASDLTIWTGGPTAPALLADSDLAPRDGWAPVEETLQSRSHPEVFIAGDAAELPTPLSKQAYHALDMGECAAENAARWLAGRDPRPFRPAEKPTLISFGDLSCILGVGDSALAGAALAPGKEAVFELVMAQLDAKPWPRRLPGMAARADRAVRRLLWPTLSSLGPLTRLTSVSLLTTGDADGSSDVSNAAPGSARS